MIHSKLAPSFSHTWAFCTKSIEFIEQLDLPPEKSSPDADEGTLAHITFAEAFTLDNPFDVEYATAQEEEFLPVAIEAVVRLINNHPSGVLLSENKVSPRRYLKTIHCDGTADIIFAVNNGALYVLDLKFGIHVVVDVIDNTQLLLYLLGALAKMEDMGYVFTEYVMIIAQPRAYHPEGRVREWRITHEELMEWAAWFKKQIHEVLTPGKGKFMPDPETTCRFCPAAGRCRALARYNLKRVRRTFADDIENKEPEYKDLGALSREEMSSLLFEFPGMRRWMGSVSNAALQTLERGAKIPFWGLREKLSDRAWAAKPEELEKYFDEEVLYETKLRSPAQVEKLAGKNSTDGFTERKVTGHTIVETDDAESIDEHNPFEEEIEDAKKSQS